MKKNSVSLITSPDPEKERESILQRIKSLQASGKSMREIAELFAAEIEERRKFLSEVHDQLSIKN
ncbi:MAG: hypothetical protein KF846_07985 [Cyclobacteriaceae bacterium]|nr:hypothetical protein [Cyclobacteriaceae bacterium]